MRTEKTSSGEATAPSGGGSDPRAGGGRRATTHDGAHPDYLALREKVDTFARDVGSRRAKDLACRAGCSACCQVQLEVCDVEARAVRQALASLDEPARRELAQRLRRAEDGSCVMLDEAGRCRIYEARPLICRTQGLPLRYPRDVVPTEAVRAAAATGEVTWCPLNFTRRTPAPSDVLDAERVDLMLALVNQRATAPEHRLRRTALRILAEEAIRVDGRTGGVF